MLVMSRVNNTKLFRGSRITYKPLNYPWAMDFATLQNQIHWLPAEVSLNQDLGHWRTKLNDSERNCLTQVQRFLASADVDISNQYVDKYLPNFKFPEVRSALLAIANIEQIHSESYALTLESLGLPESEFHAFLSIPEMFMKHEFITATRQEQNLNDAQKMMLDIAIGSILGEGMQLFSAFAIILSFYKRGLCPGLGAITKFIARDESIHADFMTKVFLTMETEEKCLTDDLKDAIMRAAYKSVELEDHFIDLAYQLAELVNLSMQEVKDYIRYITNKRINAIGLPLPFPEVVINPIPWIDELLGAPEHANFFEVRSTSYSKANFSGSWADVWGD